jgi:hypothetical protein
MRVLATGNIQVVVACVVLLGQQAWPQEKKPFHVQTASTIHYRVESGAEVVELSNVSYEVTGSGIPGRPRGERLVLRKTTHTKEVLDEKGMEASTVIEAWPLGVDLRQNPLYSVTVDGVDPRTLNGQVLVVSRGVEDVEWWSVYKLGGGDRLFDTYAPVASVSGSQGMRYVGLEVPPDNIDDARLKAPNVVAVLTYASPDRVIREALITCDDPKRARLLRSYFDSQRTLTASERGIRVTIRSNPPSSPSAVTVSVPIAADDLDVARSVAPAGLRVAGWVR